MLKFEDLKQLSTIDPSTFVGLGCVYILLLPKHTLHCYKTASPPQAFKCHQTV